MYESKRFYLFTCFGYYFFDCEIFEATNHIKKEIFLNYIQKSLIEKILPILNKKIFYTLPNS